MKTHLKWDFLPLTEAVEICDSMREPVNNNERQKRVAGKSLAELFPYYGATGQVGFIDNYIIDGEFVLLGEDGAPFLDTFAPKAYVVNGKAWVNNHAHILKSRSSNKFLCHYLNHFDYRGHVSGTTRLKLTQAEMKKIPVPVPPLPEQERIVAKIEELFSQLDAAVAELNAIKEKLQIYRQAVLKEAFNTCCKQKTPLREIATSRLGKMLDKGKNIGGTHKYLRNINVRWFNFDLSDLLDIKLKDDETEKFSIRFNDLIMCEGGEPGRCAVWKSNDTICFQKALHRIRFTNDSIPEFYMYVFYYYARTGILSPYFTGSGIKHLTGEKLDVILVPDVSRDVQSKIVTEIEKKLSACKDIGQTVNRALHQAAALRQSILKQAFEGNL